MRIAVVGATGNVGTSVLKALQNTPEVDTIIGIARRSPDTEAEPYAGCEWLSIDIAAASPEDQAVRELTRAFDGADAVIHLAWLIQPNSKRDLLRRVNVEGTRRVTQATAAAGVGQLVVASSVGAYAPDHGGRSRDESWSTDGITTSHYSVDKAAQEDVLDEFAAQHRDIVVTRLRPALTFQGAAASEIQRYFLGGWMPLTILRDHRLPVVPIPRGIQVQAVHSDDVGRAYAAAVVRRAPGAFNICADDVLTPQVLADVVDHGRYVQVPVPLLRAQLVVAHKLGLVAADAGWLDMGVQAPLMDNAKAKRELGWRPAHTAAEALQELVDGLASGSGSASIPLRRSDPDRSPPEAVKRSATDGVPEAAGVPGDIDRDLLNLYLSDHLTGAVAGSERIKKMADAYVDTPVFEQLSRVADDIRSERAFLTSLISDLGLRRLRHRQVASWVAERVARLKLNGRIVRRSPMTLVLEAELMRSAVIGKLGGWQTLSELADDLGVDRQVFVELADSAHDQLALLDEVHAYARARAFHTERKTYGADTG